MYISKMSGGLIIVTGNVASGKTTACTTLAERLRTPTTVINVGNLLVRMIKLKFGSSHVNDWNVGKMYIENFGVNAICDDLHAEITVSTNHGARKVIIDGIRLKETYECIIKRFHGEFAHLHLCVSKNLSRRRLRCRLGEEADNALEMILAEDLQFEDSYRWLSKKCHYSLDGNDVREGIECIATDLGLAG